VGQKKYSGGKQGSKKWRSGGKKEKMNELVTGGWVKKRHSRVVHHGLGQGIKKPTH